MKLIVGGKGARLFLHPGKGKTATVLKAFDLLKQQGMVDVLLVLAPLRVITTSWPSQLAEWEDFAHLTYTTIHGKDREEAMKEDVDVYLMNFESLLTPEWVERKGNRMFPSKLALEFLSRHRVMLAVDESTKMKNPSSQRFKVLKKYLPMMHYRTVMTGTPKPKHLEDLFSQCYITDLGEDLGSYITKFRHLYMRPADNGFGYVPQEGADARVAEKIAPTTLQLEYEEAVPSQVVQITLPLPENVRPMYEELSRELLTVIQNNVVMTPNAGALYNKLRQISQGFVYHEGEILHLHESKLDALENLIEELDGEPLFVLTQFKADVERIRARLGYPVPYIGSGVSAAQGASYAAQFASGSMPVLLGHPQSVAHGIDGLQRNCGNLCWFGMDWSWENYYQANLRIVRSGSKSEQVFIYRIVVDCPIDRAIIASVEDKRDSEANFLNLLRNHLQADTPQC